MNLIFLLLYGWFLSYQLCIVKSHEWTSDFAVEVVEGKEAEAEDALKDNGFRVIRKLPDLDNVYHVRHFSACPNKRCKREASDFLNTLKSFSSIKRVEQQMLLERELRDIDHEENLDRREYLRRKKDYQNFLRDFENFATGENEFKHDSEQDIHKKFKEDDEVYSKSIKERTKSNVKIKFNDPGWKYQWQLNNHGQLESVEGVDMNLVTAYSKGYRGENSIVTVVDDGVDTEHPELKPNYDPAASIDLNDPSDRTGNPRSPNSTVPPDEGHGTLCAGEIAAIGNNHLCGVGVAHRAHIGGIRLLAGAVTDLLEAFALSHNNQYIMIYSNSWGPKDDGKTLKVTPHYTTLAIERGARKGRGGKGSLFVFASGNGGYSGDSCGLDGFVNSIYTIAVTAVNHHGIVPGYTEPCSGLAVAVPVGGYHKRNKKDGKHRPNPEVISSNINGGCRSNFVGTSAATPLAAGCLALLMEANGELTWRDVQHLLFLSARIPNRDHIVWQRNGAGFPVSHYYGFGLLDCTQLVTNSQNWKTVAAQHICKVEADDGSRRLEIRALYKTEIEFTTNGCLHEADKRINRLEHVTVTVNISHVRRGDLSMWLVSPSGTKSPLLLERRKDASIEGMNFTFLSLMMWGERPSGKWILQVVDNGKHKRNLRSYENDRGYVKLAFLTLHGTYENGVSSKPSTHSLSSHGKYGRAHVMSRSQVADEYQTRRLAFIKDKPQHKRVHEIRKSLNNLDVNKEEHLNKLEEEVMKMAEDETVDVSDVESLKEDLQSKLNEFQQMKKKNPSNNQPQSFNHQSDMFRKLFHSDPESNNDFDDTLYP